MVLSVIFMLFLYPMSSSATNIFNVVNFGARPNGKTDSSNGFLRAWNAACGSASPSTIKIPSGEFLFLRPVVFSGSDCKSRGIAFRILGSLVAHSDYRILGNSGTWLSFKHVTGVTISGGTLDGNGAGLWACKKSGGGLSARCHAIHILQTLSFTNSKNIVISGVTSLNSQLYHIVINGCKNVKLKGIKVVAAGGSPNTDGIHVQLSTGVAISNSRIATGDDCVSVGAGTVNLWIENVACGPGHGISIGSLAKDLHEPGVQNVTVKMVKFTSTDNGVRIKSWGRPSDGFVRNVLFQHLTMANVRNPIIIDQNYCPNNKGCPLKASGVRISDVTYQGISGSSATEVAVKFDCSSTYPCTKIRLQDVKLTYNKMPPKSSCANAGGHPESLPSFVIRHSCEEEDSLAGAIVSELPLWDASPASPVIPLTGFIWLTAGPVRSFSFLSALFFGLSSLFESVEFDSFTGNFSQSDLLMENLTSVGDKKGRSDTVTHRHTTPHIV
ncbi:hypothetical protein Nepgr_010587 [Nepenthes gracilis]|uniref:Polygalacturonase n=1 Tax=Nepenthes gracilis TaxID=150966 RepID=A0AAD3SDQ5_NEPGR|nr:hypothetical protein Nepgr_010587 [Nepenthes gracilis]